MTRDNSSVYHIDMIDGEAKERLCEPGKEWIFETDDDITIFASEDEACTWQRAYRRKLGFDPMTGEYDDN